MISPLPMLSSGLRDSSSAATNEPDGVFASQVSAILKRDIVEAIIGTSSIVIDTIVLGLTASVAILRTV